MKLRAFTTSSLTAFAALVLALGCASSPSIDGRPAGEVGSQRVLEAAELAAREARPAESAELAEFILRNDFDFAARARVRWLAAEGRFGAGDYEDALIHYRRLLDDDPLTPRAGEVPERLWQIAKRLMREQDSFFTDEGSRFDAGIEALQMLVTYFPRDEHTDDAWRELGIAFQNDDMHQAAADCFERLARDYPDGEWADFALFHVAAEYRALSRGDAYDVEPLLVAYGALRRYLERSQEGNFRSLAVDQIREIESEVTRRELRLAEYYRFRGNLEGEKLHLANAARRFPQTAEAGAAKALLAERGYEAAQDSVDLLRPRVDRPRWASATERDVKAQAPNADER